MINVPFSPCSCCYVFPGTILLHMRVDDKLHGIRILFLFLFLSLNPRGPAWRQRFIDLCTKSMQIKI